MFTEWDKTSGKKTYIYIYVYLKITNLTLQSDCDFYYQKKNEKLCNLKNILIQKLVFFCKKKGKLVFRFIF